MSKPGPLCHLCPLDSAPGPVWGEGPTSAKLVIIGQNPGPEEIKPNEDGRLGPFRGGSGTVLNMAVQKAGGSRDRSFVTNVCKCYVPPGVGVPPKAIECCRPLLQKELNQLPAMSTILTLGSQAFTALTNKRLMIRHNRRAAEKDGSAWLRGSPYVQQSVTLIPTVHPAFVMRTGFMASFEFELDVRRAVEFASGIRVLPREEHLDDPTDGDVEDYCSEILEKGEAGLDIETPEIDTDDTELDPNSKVPIYLVGLSHTIGQSISVRPHQFELLEPLLDARLEKPVTIWAHNGAAFDFPNLAKYFSLEGIRKADSMLAFYMLWSHLTNFDLATAQSLTVDIPYYKNWRKLQPELYDTLGNCRDTYGCLWVGQHCMREMAAKPIDMRPLFWDVMMQLQPLVESWYKKGVRCDEGVANRMALELASRLNVLEQFWSKNFPLVDWQSNKQLLGLFKAMGLPTVLRERIAKDKSRHKTPTVDDEALETYVDKHKNQVAHVVQVMRGLRKGIQTVTIAEDGKLHPKLKLTAQVGGRIQSSGDNVQNMTEELPHRSPDGCKAVAKGELCPLVPDIRPRSMVVGDTKDCRIICADFSQIEFREYVWYAGARNLKAILDSGEYIYGVLYEQLFSEPFFKPGGRSKKFKRDDIPAWKLLLAKTYPMGFVYGRQPKDHLGRKLYDDFHKANPEIGSFHTRLILQVTRDRFYQTVFGRMRRFPNVKAHKNEVLSCPGQLTAVDILNNNALLPLTKAFAAMECEGIQPRIIFPQYDSVEISVHHKQAEEVAELVKRTMEQPIPQMDGLVIPAEVHIGLSWDTK